ncbi:hypothetical protein J18TS1_35920 [Oceanobacillus oncorhynchi subsp. incaldanensis]|uniref:YfhD-like protein n=1 Tax=Oceanobacillus aidingensis TaxID=645964 RepID=A0ABV9JXL8_9BACI|nr:hypothetical protein [Oceanobacillus oncorhynchi]MDM8101673.1 hypothetical protein [Oceanobacillus oncorhynchi]UUI41330.1 hypothetical protein NP440_07215 [Oceanobacillus oncorhynchi]GIO20492.1 hypothetical protein J18TS1_35920 [Oceanobacillus oncorhynchi subsp. incaldanensis]
MNKKSADTVVHMPNEDSSDSPSSHIQSREPIDEELMFFDKAKQ